MRGRCTPSLHASFYNSQFLINTLAILRVVLILQIEMHNVIRQCKMSRHCKQLLNPVFIYPWNMLFTSIGQHVKIYTKYIIILLFKVKYIPHTMLTFIYICVTWSFYKEHQHFKKIHSQQNAITHKNNS